MKTVILCGGKGTRAYPHTLEVPKPLLEVGGTPILRHVMDLYAAQGHTSFVLAAGYKGELIAQFAQTVPAGWDVDVVDTGDETGTGARVSRCRAALDDTFFLTYGDGVGDVDLGALRSFHDSHAGSATVTTVPLPSQYGTLEVGDDGRVDRFQEKPLLLDHWINAGFFVVDPDAFDHWTGDDLERQVLPALGAAGQLYAHRHRGFWKSLDTYKDAVELTALCQPSVDNPTGVPPWQRFTTPASS